MTSKERAAAVVNRPAFRRLGEAEMITVLACALREAVNDALEEAAAAAARHVHCPECLTGEHVVDSVRALKEPPP